MVPSVALPTEKQFTLRKASSCTRRCSVRVAPIAENSSLLPPVGVWAVLNPSVADRPLRPATDRRLGELLPHQLANRPQAHPSAALPLAKKHLCSCCSTSKTLCGLVGNFSPVSLTGGEVTHVLLTRPPLPSSLARQRAFDLHVLGTPPAFILSQDQTRHPWFYLPLSHTHAARACQRGLLSSVIELRSRPSCHMLHLAVRRFMLSLSPERKPLV